MRSQVWASERGSAHRAPSAFPRYMNILGSAALLFTMSASPLLAQDKTEPPAKAHAVLLNLQDAFAAIADEMEPTVVTVFSVKSGRPAPDTKEKDGKEKDKEDDSLKGLFPFGRTKQRRSTGTGSGVIIRSDGWILTNDHVVGGADKVTVKLHDGREFIGTVRRDVRSDLALIKVNAPSALPTARLGDSDKLKIGHWAVAIGSPFRYEGSFSVGVVSSLYRSQRIADFGSPEGVRFYPHMIQTDAAINPGNSGGPLCNIDGEVIAINTAIESEGGGSVGIGFAIPINAAKFVVNQLIEKGKVSYGFLGVSPVSVTPRLASALKVENGALIEFEPEANSPAAKAGMRVGDVVVGINAKHVRNELDLRTIVAQTAPGTPIDIMIVRNGQSQTLKATVGEPRESAPEKPRPPVKSKLGIEVQSITEKLAEAAGVPVKTPGVVIKSIDPDSNASEDLLEGLVIVSVNDVDTPTVQAFQAATSKIKAGDAVKIICQFEKTRKVVFVTVD